MQGECFCMMADVKAMDVNMLLVRGMGCIHLLNTLWASSAFSKKASTHARLLSESKSPPSVAKSAALHFCRTRPVLEVFCTKSLRQHGACAFKSDVNFISVELFSLPLQPFHLFRFAGRESARNFTILSCMGCPGHSVHIFSRAIFSCTV
ncbi:hypothetical protein BDR04DRAFT_14 [Suillus decipiens]|nr:hypothetical protein BDR04DRAFT_14 [Suillus decipiens]